MHLVLCCLTYALSMFLDNSIKVVVLQAGALAAASTFARWCKQHGCEDSSPIHTWCANRAVNAKTRHAPTSSPAILSDRPREAEDEEKDDMVAILGMKTLQMDSLLSSTQLCCIEQSFITRTCSHWPANCLASIELRVQNHCSTVISVRDHFP
jgi:hypothetical protein